MSDHFNLHEDGEEYNLGEFTEENQLFVGETLINLTKTEVELYIKWLQFCLSKM